MIEKVWAYVASHKMLAPGDTVIAAVSGGPDSVALLHILAAAVPLYDLQIVVAHLNHGLRGIESDGDEDFVRGVAGRLGLSFESARADIRRIKKEKGGSLEEVAREERYRFLMGVAEAKRARRVALGHHGGDQAETVLINFLRGAGPDGLKGMLPVRDGLFIRPLLAVSRSEIDAFLQEKGYAFREDSSNTSDVHLRNRIRNGLLPELKASYNSNMEENLTRLGDIMRFEDDYLQTAVRDILDGWAVTPGNEAALCGRAFMELHEALRRRIVKTVLEGLTGRGGIAYSHIQAAVDLCRGTGTSGELHLPGGIRVRRTGGKIVFQRARREPPAHPYDYELVVPGKLTVAETGETVRAEFVRRPAEWGEDSGAYLDFDRVVPPLSVRTFRPGDRFQPLGMAGTQKLKKFFINHKIDPSRRRSMPLLADRESVIWIPGQRLCDRVKVTADTRRVIRIEIV